MTFPNQYCGECTRWQLYGEPDTSEETNKDIEYYCNHICEASLNARGWMSEQEAIKRIKDHMEVHRIGDYPHIKIGVALCIAMGALEKQTPKKPYYRKEEDAEGYACPSCDMGVTVDNGRIRDAYCSHCGQALDWKE
jgi:hypothetical protein